MDRIRMSMSEGQLRLSSLNTKLESQARLRWSVQRRVREVRCAEKWWWICCTKGVEYTASRQEENRWTSREGWWMSCRRTLVWQWRTMEADDPLWSSQEKNGLIVWLLLVTWQNWFTSTCLVGRAVTKATFIITKYKKGVTSDTHRNSRPLFSQPSTLLIHVLSVTLLPLLNLYDTAVQQFWTEILFSNSIPIKILC